MNYLAHGRDFPGDPWRLAGTALPDWFRVLDRRLRIQRETAERVARTAGGSDAAALAEGVVRHLDDDRAFHSSAAFHETTGAIAELLRPGRAAVPRLRPSFVAHVVVEVLLDAELARRDPDRIRRYYDTLATLEPSDVERTAARLTPAPPAGLAHHFARFVTARFASDYVDDTRAVARIDGTFRRVGQPPCGHLLLGVLPACRAIVAARVADLLP